jgi:hypothetical protein
MPPFSTAQTEMPNLLPIARALGYKNIDVFDSSKHSFKKTIPNQEKGVKFPQPFSGFQPSNYQKTLISKFGRVIRTKKLRLKCNGQEFLELTKIFPKFIKYSGKSKIIFNFPVDITLPAKLFSLTIC